MRMRMKMKMRMKMRMRMMTGAPMLLMMTLKTWATKRVKMMNCTRPAIDRLARA